MSKKHLAEVMNTDYEDFDNESDEYFNELQTCHTAGCVIAGSHFSSECHTVEDLENYEIACRDQPN